MNKLTEKDGEFYKLKPENEVYGWENGIRLVQIVGKFEDLKEEIGCPLEALVKAIKFIKEHCSITKVSDTLTIIELGKYYIGKGYISKGSDEDVKNLLEVLENE